MPSFNPIGPLDSAVRSDGDAAFVRMNDRLRGDQLKSGEVTVSQNGRMETDGSWQPRKGINAVGDTLTANTRSIVLGAGTWILLGRTANIASAISGGAGQVTITLSSGLGPSTGESVSITETEPDSPNEIVLNGNYSVFSGGNPFTIAVVDATGTETWSRGKASWGAPYDISSATRSTTTVTVQTTQNHHIASTAIVNISGLTGSVDPNGNRLVTRTSNTEFTFTITGATGSETYTGTGVASSAALSSEQVTGVYGSCRFSDPSNSNAEYIILATNLNALAISVATGAATTINYPSGVTVAEECELLQCFDRVILFRAGTTALEWNGTLSGSPAFTRVANGAYTQPTYYNSASNTVIADGVVTVTEAAHGLSVGDRIYVVENGSSTLTENNGGYTIATVPTSGTFTFYAQVGDMSSHSVVFSKKVSVGTGYTHMPAPAWGTYHQRRLWVPYAYTMAGSSGASPTITARNISDEIIASDILDSDTYDRLQNQFRITAGTADYVVALEPFAEDNLLAFNRNSIHLLSGVSGSIADVAVRLITSEVGCVARKSIVQVGNQVLFLSDNGVYSANFGDLYNLRGAGVPLSEPIQATINRINRDYAYKAVGAYYNNRYYLAVPLDGSTTNSTILIYNFLNQGWESVDSVAETGLDIINLFPASNGGLNRLYSVSRSGSIHQFDAREDGNDRLSLFAGVAAAIYPIEASVSTRLFNMGSIERKKFSSFELHVESSESESSNATIGIEVENPDYAADLTTISDLMSGNLSVSEDASLRGRIGNKRGYAAGFVFTPTTGRPKLRAVKLNATITNPSVVSIT